MMDVKHHKPIGSFKKIFENFSYLELINVTQLHAGECICLKKHGDVIFFLDGRVNIYRISDGLLISEIKAPYMFGVIFEGAEAEYYFMEVISEGSQFTFIPHDVFFASLKAMPRDVYVELHKITSHIAMFLINRDVGFINRNAYEITCILLRELSSLPDEEKRVATVSTYVLKRSGLSKSAVMTVLRELKKGGYLNVDKKGKMLSLSKKLPKAF